MQGDIRTLSKRIPLAVRDCIEGCIMRIPQRVRDAVEEVLGLASTCHLLFCAAVPFVYVYQRDKDALEDTVLSATQ
jgi:hypothetical protein